MKYHTLNRLVLLQLCLILCAYLPCLAGELEEGNYDYYNGNYADAEDHYTAYINSNSSSDIAYNNRGLAKYHQGMFAEAIRDFDKAISLDIDYAAPYINKGKAFTAQKQFNDAIATYQAGMAYDPHNPKLLFGIGWIYDELGNFEEALEKYDAALAADPEYHRAQLGKAVTLAKQNKIDEASNASYEYINNAPENDFWRIIASYNLQLLRSSGLDFASDLAAQNFQNGIFKIGLSLFNLAANDFGLSQKVESNVPDIPWLRAMAAALGSEESETSSSYLKNAHSLMSTVEIEPNSSISHSTIYINGIDKGSSPATLYFFPGQYEITIRSVVSGKKQERNVPVYGSDIPCQLPAVVLTLEQTSEFAQFSPLEDTDQDWLDDEWETAYFRNLTQTAQGNPDSDRLLNIEEYWALQDPGKININMVPIIDLLLSSR